MVEGGGGLMFWCLVYKHDHDATFLMNEPTTTYPNLRDFSTARLSTRNHCHHNVVVVVVVADCCPRSCMHVDPAPRVRTREKRVNAVAGGGCVMVLDLDDGCGWPLLMALLVLVTSVG